MMSLLETGYVVAPRVLDPRRVKSVRGECEAHLKGQPGGSLPASDVLASDLFVDAIVLGATHDALERILGEEPIYLPNFTVRRDVFTAFHVDEAFRASSTGGVGPRGLFYQCSIFLQDNDAASG